jgi:aminoglycoside 6'-N-acetyltransferase I
MPPIRVRPAVAGDAAAWLEMRRALWPDDPDDTHPGEIARYFDGSLRNPLEVLIAIDAQQRPVGFVELSIRNYAEDCETDRVAYLEGWYVVPGLRRQGVGRALVAAAEDWARAQGCTEFGSDAVLDNEPSAAAHVALGFEETARIRCFKKML